MGLATLNGRAFRIDPESVAWSYTIKVADFPTIGGKVVQVYGAELGDLVVEGSFGVGGWQDQKKFLEDMKEIANNAVYNARTKGGPNPVTFTYSPKGWSFQVYLTGYTDGRSSRAVTLDNEVIHNPRWQLTFMVVENNAGLERIAMDDYIQRLSEGIGWKRTGYNGPLTPHEVQNVSLGGSIYDIAEMQGPLLPSQQAAAGG